jgi:hypothetical protein
VPDQVISRERAALPHHNISWHLASGTNLMGQAGLNLEKLIGTELNYPEIYN